MSRYTLARDFRSIDPRQTRVILIEAGPVSCRRSTRSSPLARCAISNR
jgi:hypothetical protein